MMKELLKDALIGFALACVVVLLMMFASFNSTFIYRGF
jgi:CHASE3 domain sensor protein